MNDSTRETLETLSISAMRTMEHLRRQIQRAQADIDKYREQVRDESRRVNEYLDSIAKADPRFDRNAWLNHVEREWLV